MIATVLFSFLLATAQADEPTTTTQPSPYVEDQATTLFGSNFIFVGWGDSPTITLSLLSNDGPLTMGPTINGEEQADGTWMFTSPAEVYTLFSKVIINPADQSVVGIWMIEDSILTLNAVEVFDGPPIMGVQTYFIKKDQVLKCEGPSCDILVKPN